MGTSKLITKQVEYLIHQSIQGNHILFDNRTLRAVFWKAKSFSAPLTKQEMAQVKQHITCLIQKPSLMEKKAYLKNLNQKTLEKIVKIYFCIVENNLYKKIGSYH